MSIAAEEIIEWIEEAISYVGDPAWSPSLEREGRILLERLKNAQDIVPLDVPSDSGEKK